jgi:hypothetical protein
MARTKGAIHKPKSLDPGELREVLKPIHEKLRKAGVPDERMPSNEALVSKILDWIDDKEVGQWVADYAKTMK